MPILHGCGVGYALPAYACSSKVAIVQLLS